MSMDRKYYYDFDAEPAIENWIVNRQPDGNHLFTNTFIAPTAGDYTLLFATRRIPSEWKILTFKAADREFQAYETSIAFISPDACHGFRSAFTVNLNVGAHRLELRVQSNVEHPESWFKAAWIALPLSSPEIKINNVAPIRPQAGKAGVGAPRSHVDVCAMPVMKDFRTGIGAESCASAGRFGYTKGDGVLDCAMPILGVIDKMYLCGHPKYKKPYKWTYAVLPPGIDPMSAYHGSVMPAQVGLENDELTVNHLSVKWKTSFAATADFFDRNAGAKVDFACTYSLASPGILIETSDPGISLSMLEYAGNYQYILIPGADGVQCRALDGEFKLAGAMSENWALVCGATEFPDIPILLVFTRAPDVVRARRNSRGCLTALDFHVPQAPGHDTKIFVATPFGIGSFDPSFASVAAASDGRGNSEPRSTLRRSSAPAPAAAVEPAEQAYVGSFDEQFTADAIERCRFWSRAFMAYPVKCAEYYKLDEASEKVEIIQKFEYREFADQWRTTPLKTAPLPPVLSLLDGTGMVESDGALADFKFPTKYGFLKGAVDRDWVAYTIPYMPRARRFPLRDTADKSIPALLADGMDEYFEFHENFSADTQAYPYAGSALEPYAWSAPLFNFMAPEYRTRLAEKLAGRLVCVCDPERRYDYPVISWSDLMREMPGRGRVMEIYRDPAMKTMGLYNWYLRKEPFTGVEYRICYLNVGIFSSGSIKQGTREEVAGLKMPLIENDWGAGLAFYYIYLAAQISGDFSAVRKNWSLLCEGFDYFAKLHDWACMATAYSDNGISWVEGANYGAFTSFVNLAGAVGDQESYAKGVYLAAKQMALRFAKFRSAQTYFYKYFDHAPWFTAKTFHEEASSGNAFQNVPELWRDVYRMGAMYNFTTEGLYPEIFEALNKFLPDEFAILRDLALQSYAEGLNSKEFSWAAMQESCSCLIAAALDEHYDAERLLAEIDKVEKRGQLIKEWRGIHIFSRLLPKNYFKCQLLAWLAGRKHPVWLEYWTDVEILCAEYDSGKQTVRMEFQTRGPAAVIRFGARRTPANVRLNGKIPHGWHMAKGRLIVPVAGGGTLELTF